MQYRQYRMCMYLLECVCMWFSSEQYCVCIEPVWCLYFGIRYKLIHTCLYVPVFWMYLDSIQWFQSEFFSWIRANTYMYVCACILIVSWLYLIGIFQLNSCKHKQIHAYNGGKQKCFYWKISSTMFNPPQQGQTQGQKLGLRRILAWSLRQVRLLLKPPPFGLENADENPSKNRRRRPHCLSTPSLSERGLVHEKRGVFWPPTWTCGRRPIRREYCR